nr:cation transporter dimerization domain-containing protein [Methylomarinum sp. Ch1-1]MDP4522095.1 cation transporter dimerization domain-containing protein [Methylomarinum sp. Ch1-1]
MTVSEGHMIGDIVRDQLKSEFDDIVDVLVHVDPEDDEFKKVNEPLLTRKEIQTHLEHYLGEFWPYIDEFRVHYLDGLLELEVMLPPMLFSQQQQVEKIKQRCALLEKRSIRSPRYMCFLKPEVRATELEWILRWL